MSFCALLESDDDFDRARYEAIHAGVPAFPGVRGRAGIWRALRSGQVARTARPGYEVAALTARQQL